MNLTAAMQAPCAPEALFSWVDDLSRYPSWLGIVERAEPLFPLADGEAAWMVDLRGKVGPLARSKRLRMVRTDRTSRREPCSSAGRPTGATTPPGCWRPRSPRSTAAARSAMRLHYGGALWGPVLERLLGDEVDRSRDRLLALVSGPRR